MRYGRWSVRLNIGYIMSLILKLNYVIYVNIIVLHFYNFYMLYEMLILLAYISSLNYLHKNEMIRITTGYSVTFRIFSKLFQFIRSPRSINTQFMIMQNVITIFVNNSHCLQVLGRVIR